MNELALPSSLNLLPVAPRVAIATRVATMDDLPFLDGLQKQHSKALGFFPRAQMEGYVENGWVLIAEDTATKQPLGYCASRDRYLKRDELGVIYQLCVATGHQRGLIGANLVKAVFDRSAYGCRLYCCWCAQDLGANSFWESLGFLPIAFRAGSTGKRRVHIFWQRRINIDDVNTPYWYPCQTNAGAIRADRLVFPIPPGTHWTEVQAVAVPSADANAKTLPQPKVVKRESKPVTPPQGRALASSGGLRFSATQPLPPAKTVRPRVEQPPVKLDAKLIAAARELRDRYLERANDEVLIAPRAKYDVSRRVASVANAGALPLLKAG